MVLFYNIYLVSNNLLTNLKYRYACSCFKTSGWIINVYRLWLWTWDMKQATLVHNKEVYAFYTYYIPSYAGPSPPCGVTQLMFWLGHFISQVLQCIQFWALICSLFPSPCSVSTYSYTPAMERIESKFEQLWSLRIWNEEVRETSYPSLSCLSYYDNLHVRCY